MFETLTDWLQRLPEAPLYYPILGGLLAALCIFLFFKVKLRHRHTPVKVYNNTSGYVLVSRQALLELVRTATMEVGVASKPKVQFYHKHGRLSLEVHIKLNQGQRAVDVCSAIQNHLSRALRDSLGVDRLGSINVTIDGYKGKGAVKTTASPLDKEKTGPVPVYQKDEKKAEPQETKKPLEKTESDKATSVKDKAPESVHVDNTLSKPKTETETPAKNQGFWGRKESDKSEAATPTEAKKD